MGHLPQSLACSECDAAWTSRLKGNTASACLCFFLFGYLTLECSHHIVMKYRPHGRTQVEMNWSAQPKASVNCHLTEWAFKWIQVQAFKFSKMFLRALPQILWRRDKPFMPWLKIPDLYKPGEIIHDNCYFKSVSLGVIWYTAKYN